MGLSRASRFCNHLVWCLDAFFSLLIESFFLVQPIMSWLAAEAYEGRPID